MRPRPHQGGPHAGSPEDTAMDKKAQFKLWYVMIALGVILLFQGWWSQ